MSEKLTPLEALERLTNYKCSCMSEKIECKEIVETALKDYDLMKKLFEGQKHNLSCLMEENRKMKQDRQAVKIIKELPKEEKQILLNAIYTYTKSEEKYDLLEELLFGR